MNSEQAKYELLWGTYAQYRKHAPGENLADLFLSLAHPMPHQICYDFGCGTGRGAARIAKRCSVVGFDFAANCLDPDVAGAFEFVQHDLTKPMLGRSVADFGYCTDVLEHVSPEDVDVVLANILARSRRVFLCIATDDDVMGALIGEPLHLTVRPMQWWIDKLEGMGFKVQYKRNFDDTACVVYGTAWATFSDFEHRVELNVEMRQMQENILRNLSLGLAEVGPHEEQDIEVMLLCGGPSLNDFADEIVAKNKAGTPVITPESGAVTLQGAAPAIARTENAFATPAPAQIVVTGFTPAFVVDGPRIVTPSAGSVVIGGYAPVLHVTAVVLITPPAAQLVVQTFAPRARKTAYVAGNRGVVVSVQSTRRIPPHERARARGVDLARAPRH